MPTYGDETLHERYAREHADHLARLAKMTPEQIAEMELSLHNAMAELDRLRAQASQGGEAVEVVATVESYGGNWAGVHWGDCIGSTEDPERQLMTVAQHDRIMAATVPAGCKVVKVECIAIALDAVQNAMGDAYNNAYQDCCGRGQGECCGNPIVAWSDADQAIMDALAPAQRELSALLASAILEVKP